MRLRFGELSAAERVARERVCAQARDAWHGLSAGDVNRACALMQAIDERIGMTVQTADDDSVTHVEIAAFESGAWPLAELLLAQAPHDLGVALSLGQSAVPLARALDEVRASHAVELTRATLRAGFGRGHLLELTLGIPGAMGGESQQNAAENLVRRVLGDRLFETWIGVVHVTPAPRGGSLRVLDVNAERATLTLNELFDTVAAAVCGVLQGLPETGHAAAHVGSANAERAAAVSDASRDAWTLLEVERVADARGTRKDDLVLASSCTPELLRCYLDGSPCASRRFSRVGEQFVFLSYADDERHMERRLARRTAIETALSEAVAGIGAVTGVGFGVHTSYVDLALCNLETGLARLVAKLRSMDVPANATIQFFDSELAEECVAIWPDSRPTGG